MRQGISMLYGIAVFLRNRWYDWGLSVRTVGIPVISVGNITVGGTGKTPMVIAIAELLQRSGQQCAIVSRGYGRRSQGLVVVSDGKGMVASLDNAGDELALIAERLPQAIVIAAADRHAGATAAWKQFGATVVVLDDGFQHRRLHRNLDIVMVDAATVDTANSLIPLGTLREPRSSLRRAQLLCAVDVDPNALMPLVGDGAMVIRAIRQLRRWRTLHGEPTIPPTGTVTIACAIARPEQFIRLVQQVSGVKIGEVMVWPDHHWYTTDDVQMLIARTHAVAALSVVTTEKDAVKLRQYAPELEAAGIRVAVARLSLVFPEPDRSRLIEQLAKVTSQ
ncbi:MAG: tetraacyldisaccharide 4'-kinase [Bacteroidota bacterium]|nr:tetraacyldisaccharide 4'-kinase [Candidatus Kapabacteria bacterium]MCS7302674.1 tetraacyldisaccharide 4'-kinase [Candidatus Kapabacteria bacterium]MCX7936182.1 tetraacyldisaccharide 4'-kinase [Chlorobiota bacterium]MDW8074924.1 tetraacyldisaccharide 4'-kinase [Bacteroidota bacterium]MDW8271563.1 tetraacyldisaccharide 4'-kinase [Bacteroidota bacterium]